MASGASAGGMRESWRQLRYATLSPLGKMVEAELTRKLETEITLGWDALAASDCNLDRAVLVGIDLSNFDRATDMPRLAIREIMNHELRMQLA